MSGRYGSGQRARRQLGWALALLGASLLGHATSSVASTGVARANPAQAGAGGARRLSRASRSVGLPFRGRLRRGVRSVETAHVHHTGEYARHGRHFGTWELVQLVERAAARVASRAPGARLSVGELSAEDGGPIPGHNSHQNGRDVDLAFYMLDGRGRPLEPWAFAAFDREGHGQGANEGLRFDDRRNFELVAKLVTDGDARVQYIFVSDAIKRRLLRVGRALGARSIVLDRLQAAMVQPASGHPHHNHFHVRIYCAPADRPACEDRGPFHPWYPGVPPGGALVGPPVAAATP